MRRGVITILLVLSVLVTGGLSALAMSAMDHSEMSTCLIPMGNTECPVQVNAMATLAHHMDGVRALGEAILGTVFSTIVLTFLSSAFLAFLFFRPSSFYAVLREQLTVARAQLRERVHITPLRNLLHWLALIYARDPHTSIVVHGNLMGSQPIRTRAVFA